MRFLIGGDYSVMTNPKNIKLKVIDTAKLVRFTNKKSFKTVNEGTISD